jgi:hypothetical protein
MAFRGSFLLECGCFFGEGSVRLEDLEALGHVPFDVDAGAERLADASLPVDDERDPWRQDAEKALFDPEETVDGFARITEQGEWQAVIGDEPLMGCDGICAHPHDLGSCRHKILIGVAEEAGFLGAAIGFILGIEVEHDRSVFERIAQSEGFSGLILEAEIRCNSVDG